jgi:hypothetical protein
MVGSRSPGSALALLSFACFGAFAFAAGVISAFGSWAFVALVFGVAPVFLVVASLVDSAVFVIGFSGLVYRVFGPNMSLVTVMG